MPNRHPLEDHGSTFLDEKYALGGLVWRLVGLDDGVIGSQTPDGDVFVDGDTRFGVDGVRHLDDGAVGGISRVNGRLDGGEIAASSTHGVGRGKGSWRRQDRCDGWRRWDGCDGGCLCGW